MVLNTIKKNADKFIDAKIDVSTNHVVLMSLDGPSVWCHYPEKPASRLSKIYGEQKPKLSGSGLPCFRPTVIEIKCRDLDTGRTFWQMEC